MDWITENKEMLFSGVLITVPLTIIGWIFFTKSSSSQKQKGGKNSTNIQVGGNFEVNKKDD